MFWNEYEAKHQSDWNSHVALELKWSLINDWNQSVFLDLKIFKMDLKLSKQNDQTIAHATNNNWNESSKTHINDTNHNQIYIRRKEANCVEKKSTKNERKATIHEQREKERAHSTRQDRKKVLVLFEHSPQKAHTYNLTQRNTTRNYFPLLFNSAQHCSESFLLPFNWRIQWTTQF